MKMVWIILAVVIIAVLIFGGKFVGVRNQIVTQKEAITAAWAQVDNVMQRRADLIPNLVETVKGYAKHEQAAIQSVTQARAAFAGARTPQERIAANSGLDSAISRLLAIVENYPNLKADQQFLNLQRELAGTENRIAIERQRYNQAVQAYNTNIQLFPNNIVASLAGYSREDAYFKTEPGARAVPKVAF
jgi:LemA protein